MKKQKVWHFKPFNGILQYILAQELGVSEIVAQMLVNRGIFTVFDARSFLAGTLKDLHDPFLMRDMEQAVKRTMAALKAGERILVYGDYDVDGFTSTVVMLNALRSLGAKVDYYIPNRMDEGYSLNINAISQLYETGTGLIITVDCGIASLEEAVWAKENGLDLIITDHHEPGNQLPDALAVVDPKREDCHYPFKELAGVGVALKFVQALFSAAGKGKYEWQSYLDLVCLGTVADIVPLRDENRVLVKHGLKRLSRTTRPGLQALISVSRIDKEKITPRDVGFILAPRLNAAGRIGDPRLGVELLLCENPKHAQEIAEILEKENTERQRLEGKAFSEALDMLKSRPGIEKEKVIVLASPEWHPGVIGIVASKLNDRFYRPVLLVALEGSEGRGSARSIPGFNMYEALEHCRDCLLKYGGHAQAAGFSIEAEKVDELRRKINEYADMVLEEGSMVPCLELDYLISLEDISEALVKEIEQLSPYGQSNPVPLLGCKGASVLACREVGKTGAHLKMILRDKKAVVEGIGFNLSKESGSNLVSRGKHVDLVFTPGINEWNGKRSVQLEVKDLQYAALPSWEIKPREDNNDFDVFYDITSETLRQAGYSLFTPEYLDKKLSQYYRNIEIKIRPNPAGINEFNGKVVDLRHKIPVNVNQLVNNEKKVLLVTTPYQTIETAYYLRKVTGKSPEKIGYYHPLVNGVYQHDILKKFEYGEIETLVCTYGSVSETEFHSLPKLVAFRLPFSLEELRHVLANVSKQGSPFELDLMYSDTDISFNRQKMEAFAPGRDCLGAFYLLMKRHADKTNSKFTFKTAVMLRTLRMMGFSCVEAYTVRIALTILSEIGLLKYYEIEQGWHVQLGRRPSQKLNLRDSGTYIWTRQVQDRLLSEQTAMLQAQAGELLSSM